MQVQYIIRKLSVLAIRNAKETDDGGYVFWFSENATKKCISHPAPRTQDDCTLFCKQKPCSVQNPSAFRFDKKQAEYFFPHAIRKNHLGQN